MVQIKKILFVFFVVLGFLSSCTPEQEIVVEVEEEMILTKGEFAHALKDQFEKTTTVYCQDNLPYTDTLKTFYASRDYEPLWWNALIGDSASWEELRQTIAYSTFHGMDSLYYSLGLVDYYRREAVKDTVKENIYALLAELELVLSNNLLKMYSDIANGRTDPKEVYGYTYMLPRNNLKELDYFTFLEDKDKTGYLDRIHSEDTTYQELLKVMDHYIQKKKQDQSSTIDFSDYPKIEVGDTADVISLIIAKLKSRNLPDSSIQTVADTSIYTKELEIHIKELQERYSLTPDGIMGYKTYKVINASPSNKINKVKANLERQRWFTKPDEKPFVYINLPEYMVELHWEDSAKSMKVCIGKNLPDNYDAMVQEYTDSGWLYKLPKNMETPQIASKISYLVVNPTWTVPYSIIRREMWWKLVRDPTYLSSKGFRVYRGKEEINGDTIQWSRINKNKIPYTIVEDPGPKNSLGTVKYIFYNPFSIYLHDTPNKRAFKRTQRAVSHGCVRLEEPILFGEFLMQNSDEYDADDFRIMMGKEPLDPDRLEEYDPPDSLAAIQPLDTTTMIRLDQTMPVYLDYRTIYFDREWGPHYGYDIYDQNKLILREMERM